MHQTSEGEYSAALSFSLLHESTFSIFHESLRAHRSCFKVSQTDD